MHSVMKTISATVTIVFFIMLPSCTDLTEKDKSEKMMINYLLDSIEDAVSQYMPNDVIDKLHHDFLHNGKNNQEQSYIWEERLLLFYSLSIEDRIMDIKDDLAVVHFTMIFRGDQRNIVSQEPSEKYGDLSYLIKENGQWYFYGNRE